MGTSAAIGMAASALGTAFAWPQAVRALRAPSLAGVSVPGQLLLLVTALSWTSYAVVRADAVMFVGNLSAGVAVVVTVVALQRLHLVAPRRVAGTLAGWAVAVAVGVVALGPSAVGLLGALLGVAMTVPQALALRRGEVPEGVASATWALLGATMACWLVYGLLEGDPIIVAPNVLAAPVVLSVWRAVRRHEHLAVPPAAPAAFSAQAPPGRARAGRGRRR